MLHQIKWDDGLGLEEIVTWGLNPIKELLEILDEHNEDEDSRLTFFYYEIRNKLQEIEATLYRMRREIND